MKSPNLVIRCPIQFLQKAYVIHWIRLDGSLTYEKAYSNGMQHLENLVAKLHDIEP